MSLGQGLLPQGIVSPIGGKENVFPPRILTANGAVVTLFDRENGDGRLFYAYIQNQAAAVVYIAINTDASAEVYHKVLNACSGAKDGLGGEMEIKAEDMLGITKITAFSAGAFTVSGLIITRMVR